MHFSFLILEARNNALVEKLEEKLNEQTNAIKELQKMLVDQNEVLARQSVLMKRISSKVFPLEAKDLNIFPIANVEDLENWTIGDNCPEEVVSFQTDPIQKLQKRTLFFLFTDFVHKKHSGEARYIKMRPPLIYRKLPFQS